MAEKSSKADYLKSADIMAALGSKYEKQVLYFLEKAGMCDEEFMKTFDGMTDKSSSPGRRKNIDPDFVALLKEVEELKNREIEELGKDASYFSMMKYWRNVYGIQQSRINAWREGRSGLSEELKIKLTKEFQEYVYAQKNKEAVAKNILAGIEMLHR